MIVTFEISNPFLAKPRFRPQKGLGFRIIWLWFGFSFYRTSWSAFIAACVAVGMGKNNRVEVE